NTNEKFYNTHTYVIRLYIYGGPTSDDDDESFRIAGMVFNGSVITPPSVPPTVTTTAVSAVTKYTANVTGSYQTGSNYHLVKQSGVVWGTATNPKASLATKTTNGAGGTINSNISGLTPGTQYHVRAYAITQVDTIYGSQLTFTTLAPSAPTLTTVAAYNILSNKATSGGSNIDSGGYAVLEKGICWNTTGTPTITDAHNLEGSGNADFASVMKLLQPNKKYYVRAFARNSLGYGYGNQIDFTTGPAVPSITAVPGTLNFGNVSYASSPLTLSYTLSATNLSPSTGSITITPPATGYKISTSPNSGFVNTPITVAYLNGVLTNAKIYVQASTDTYGTFNRYVVHSATGVAAQDADTVFLYSNVVMDPAVQTNSGTDFWVGFGYQERMDRKAGDAAEAKLSVYVAAGDQDATVTVSLPGIAGAAGYPQTNVFIPKNTVKEFTNFPTGDASNNMNPNNLPDTRLFYTGVSSRAVHITSTNGVPVSVWMHTYANNNSAAGAMVFPTNTWNSAYTVQAYGGVTNNSNPNSFFFVIANEDNTVIEFTPKNDIVDSSTAVIFKDGNTAANVKYQKGVTYQLTLNKGQIFNAMGFIQGSGKNTANGLDLTGTTVKSRDCNKKIAVFGGNGRCLVGTSGCNLASADGSDNLVQQMFPKVAWGTKYLTVPTKNMEYNTFRITVQDPTTNVYVNGSTTPLATSSLVNGLYYELEGNAPNMIESDKPITVTQFIIAGYCKSTSAGNSGNGDPEMIILCPVQQAINKATEYS
ncbi:IgGFc-binding protein, partial [Aetokthonos hydrillicola]|uniref:IgGFc-binding protein n=1 Tax=Aetokthonos hydrillicola TaxID=1550245 RepID=UPI001ABA2FFD